MPVELSNGRRGTTQNVSETGVLFDSDCTFAPGERIRFCLVLEHVDAEGPLVVECEGFVVRVERAESAAAVAVQFQSYQFSHRARDDAGAQEG